MTSLTMPLVFLKEVPISDSVGEQAEGDPAGAGGRGGRGDHGAVRAAVVQADAGRAERRQADVHLRRGLLGGEGGAEVGHVSRPLVN